MWAARCVGAACRSADGESYSGPWKRDKRDGTDGTSALTAAVNLCVGRLAHGGAVALTAAVLTVSSAQLKVVKPKLKPATAALTALRAETLRRQKTEDRRQKTRRMRSGC